jgi:hypothetical protein
VQAGVEYEGETLQVPSAEARKAISVATMLANGYGGFDWSALDVAVAMYEVENVEQLIDNLVAIKLWRPPKDAGKE